MDRLAARGVAHTGPGGLVRPPVQFFACPDVKGHKSDSILGRCRLARTGLFYRCNMAKQYPDQTWCVRVVGGPPRRARNDRLSELAGDGRYGFAVRRENPERKRERVKKLVPEWAGPVAPKRKASRRTPTRAEVMGIGMDPLVEAERRPRTARKPRKRNRKSARINRRANRTGLGNGGAK